jgi:hypothetical protein
MPLIKDSFGIRLKNGSMVKDEESNQPLLRPTKRALYLMYGADADVQPVRSTHEFVVRPKKAKKAKV